MFKSLNKEFCKKVTWLKLNDCFLFDLKLSRLFEYFPNLHKLSIKNTFIKSITDQDIDQLEIICNRYQLETKKNLNNFWADFLEKESRKYMQLYSLKFSVQKPNDIIIQKITKYLKEKLHYSFILDLNGCLINQNCFEPLKNNNDQKIYKKTLLIKGIKTSNQGSSSFQKFIFRLFTSRFFVHSVLITIMNFCIIKTLFTKAKSFGFLICVIFYTIASVPITWFLFNYVYNKLYLIDKKIIFD